MSRYALVWEYSGKDHVEWFDTEAAARQRAEKLVCTEGVGGIRLVREVDVALRRLRWATET